VTEPEIVVRPDVQAASDEAAGRIAAVLAAAAAERGVAHWATTGGSTPAPIYARLATEPLRPTVPWDRVHLWFTDERFVALDHKLSNAKIALDSLLHAGAMSGMTGMGGTGADVLLGATYGAPIPGGNVHPMPTGEAIGRAMDAAWCATRAVEELRASGPPLADGWPVFDLILVGVGPDGHLFSVFPGSVTWDSDDWVVAVPAPSHVEPHVERVTLNPRILDAARQVIVVVTGDGKRDVIGRIFGEERDPRQLPAQLALREGATWILDEAAAGSLPRRT
jgi:6-phosphogluconolactonase/glucosamine-6-phosphate isomerase/deaminase